MMTETRGEGLAGHGWNVEQILVYIWQCIAGESSEQEYPYAKFANSEVGKRLRVEIAALEAAAPPSTAHTEKCNAQGPNAECICSMSSLIEQMADLPDEFEERYQSKGAPHHAVSIDSGVLRRVLDDLAMEMRVAALATPSPQAPAEQEEPWCELCGHTGWLRDSDGNRTERCVCAATQEPAGSGASEPSVGDLVVVPARVIGVKPYLRVVVDGTEPNTPSALVMKPGFVRALNDWRVGSPCKVGEDGADDKNYYASYANHCAIQRQIPLTFPAWKKQGKVNAPDTTVSSAPVGEQK